MADSIQHTFTFTALKEIPFSLLENLATGSLRLFCLPARGEIKQPAIFSFFTKVIVLNAGDCLFPVLSLVLYGYCLII